MGKKVSSEALVADCDGAESAPRPRLVRLIIKNFRCIGPNPVTIELDDIVVLVGPNNVGKSSILKAYEVIMCDGSRAGNLALEDFPNGKLHPENYPEIELHTVVYDNSPGIEWITKTETGESLVREIWRWKEPGAPSRRGFNVIKQSWALDGDKEKMPWGAAAVANSKRPQPHFVDAFASPDEQTKAIIDLLMECIREKIKSHKTKSVDDKETDFSKLLSTVSALQKTIVAEAESDIKAVQRDLSDYIGKVFPGQQVIFDAKAEEEADLAGFLFKTNAQLLMGPTGGHLSTISRQGSGARRTLLWSAIRLIADSDKKKNESSQRPHVLLIDEPEMCLHPGAVREACDLLYSLPAVKKNWQIMVTTHSPCFVDFSRDHTSIVRVERGEDGNINGTTIFRPDRANFGGSDKELLKLLNMCDPYVAEFFFGGKVVIVEGDTEYAAFKHIIGTNPETYKGVHIVRARGKATIVSLCKILNQFGTPYAILHDSDRPTYMKDGTAHKNPAWAHNKSILDIKNESGRNLRLVASIPNFEAAYLGEEIKSEKPYNALSQIKANSDTSKTITKLLDALIDFTKPLPTSALEWSEIDKLEQAVTAL